MLIIARTTGVQTVVMNGNSRDTHICLDQCLYYTVKNATGYNDNRIC